MSPGQWGHAAFFAFLAAGLGSLIIHRAERSDVTYAFLLTYMAVILGRALWLGDPLRIPLHQLQNGALLIFAFFMISDPKTTPDSRPGRILYAALIAVAAAFLQFRFYQSNGPLWALVGAAPLVPLIDRWLPGRRYFWPTPKPQETFLKEHPMKLKARTALTSPLVCLILLLGTATSASAFCGFYVAKADAQLFNQASQVVLVRDGERTVLTMANDFRGDLSEFAVVIPVPTFLEREQIHVAEQSLIDHLDAYSAPRLVEYFRWGSLPPGIRELEAAGKHRGSRRCGPSGAQGESSRCLHRGFLLRGGIRHPDPLGGGKQRPRHLAPGQRLPPSPGS